MDIVGGGEEAGIATEVHQRVAVTAGVKGDASLIRENTRKWPTIYP